MTSIQEKIDKQVNAFMSSSKKGKPHTILLVEGFVKHEDKVAFIHNDNSIEIPLSHILSPKMKKTVKEDDYIDYEKKLILLIIGGTTITDLTKLNESAICETCRTATVIRSVPIIDDNWRGLIHILPILPILE